MAFYQVLTLFFATAVASGASYTRIPHPPRCFLDILLIVLRKETLVKAIFNNKLSFASKAFAPDLLPSRNFELSARHLLDPPEKLKQKLHKFVQFVPATMDKFGGPCSRQDPNVDTCLLRSFNSLMEYMKGGAPELGIKESEAIVIDELSIALGGGPDGYRATFKDIHATGASNMTITNVRSDLETHQFQLTLFGPHISARARYRSSGVLLLVRASGGGDYWGEYEGVKAKVYFRGAPYERDGRTHLRLEQLKLDFSVKDIQMGVENLQNSNSVLQAALNLFINTNAQELLKEMKPELKRDLAEKMSRFLERILEQIPYDEWVVD